MSEFHRFGKGRELDLLGSLIALLTINHIERLEGVAVRWIQPQRLKEFFFAFGKFSAGDKGPIRDLCEDPRALHIFHIA